MKRVLIIKTSSMGDVVHNLPVIADIRHQRPDSVIDWVVEEAYVDIVRMTRGVERVIPMAWRRWRRNPALPAVRAERQAFIDRLHEQRYDLVLDTQGLVKSAWLARRARLAPRGVRAGFSFGLARESIARLFYDHGYAVDPRLHAIERMRALAAQAFGYDYSTLGPPRFELDIPALPASWYGWLPQSTGADGVDPHPRAYAVLLHATARPEKAWPLERWAALAGVFCEAGIVPVLPWGSPREREQADAIVADAIASKPADRLRPVVAPSMSLQQAAAVLAHAQVVVGVDTGLLHLAAALGTATVGLFGATPRWRYAPYWSMHAINLGSFGELGAQPPVSGVVASLGQLGVIAGAPAA